MQNDLFWYNENDEDYYALMPPFNAGDLDGFPSEDKHIMTVQTAEHVENSMPGDQSPWDSTLRESSKSDDCKYYYELGERFQLEKDEKKCKGFCNGYSCSDPMCVGSGNTQRVYAGDPVEYGSEAVIYTNGDRLSSPVSMVLTTSDSNLFSKNKCTYDRRRGYDDLSIEKGIEKNKTDNYGSICDEAIVRESHETEVAGNEECGAITDELSIYETNEDDYEIFQLKIVHRKNRTGFEESKEFAIVMNSIIAGRYYVTEFLGSAAFSKVVQAHDLYVGRDVCLKIIKNDKDFFDQSLDEIKLLKYVNKHDPADEHHILRLYDYFYYQEHLFIVTELLKANLYEFQKFNQESCGEPYFTFSRLQVITQQCLEALMYLHSLGIMHCDLKPENILIKSYRRCEIKVIDLGSSCFETDNLSLYVQSRSYRAPEVMLGLPYDQKIDLWSLGCILAELCSGEVLFPNEGVVTILARIIGIIGPIDTEMLLKGMETDKYFTKEYDLFHINEDTNEIEYIVPDISSLEHYLGISDRGFINFLKYLLQINPKRRPTAREALRHPWLSRTYDEVKSD